MHEYYYLQVFISNIYYINLLIVDPLSQFYSIVMADVKLPNIS